MDGGGRFAIRELRRANHDIVIVGWDDHYPKENFSRSPEADGAFLCLNSWGSGFGEDGYFYVSYEDSQIGLYGISYSGLEDAERYSRIYQTDLRGWTGQMGYGSSSAWFANVYTAQETERIAALRLLCDGAGYILPGLRGRFAGGAWRRGIVRAADRGRAVRREIA